MQGDGALTAQIGLQISHQESGGDTFSGNVSDDEAEAMAAEVEEIVVVAAHFAGLDASSGVVQRFEGRELLREETRLDLFGNFQFLGGAAFGFAFFGEGAALGFERVRDFVEADETEGVSVDITEAG